MSSVPRVYNFSSGPAVLPLPVTDEIQRDLMALPGVGLRIPHTRHPPPRLRHPAPLCPLPPPPMSGCPCLSPLPSFSSRALPLWRLVLWRCSWVTFCGALRDSDFAGDNAARPEHVVA